MPSSPVRQKPTLCVAAGKSGGHLIPALELAQQWHNQQRDGTVALCTYKTLLDEKIYRHYSFISTVQSFTITTFVKNKLWLYPIIIYQALKACLQAWLLLRTLKPEKVITTGGFVALPVSIAARLVGIPVEAYELNVHPGKAIKALAMLGAQIFVVFRQTLQSLPNAKLVQYPIRFAPADIKTQEQALHELTKLIPSTIPLQNGRFTLFIAGGSQGSQYLNNLAIDLFQKNPLLKQRIQIIHQAGAQAEQYRNYYDSAGIAHLVFDFHPAIAQCYQAADLVICRAGAGTLFELAYFKRPAIIVPLITASTNHQEANALAMATEIPELFSVWKQSNINADPTLFFNAIIQKIK